MSGESVRGSRVEAGADGSFARPLPETGFPAGHIALSEPVIDAAEATRLFQQKVETMELAAAYRKRQEVRQLNNLWEAS